MIPYSRIKNPETSIHVRCGYIKVYLVAPDGYEPMNACGFNSYRTTKSGWKVCFGLGMALGHSLTHEEAFSLIELLKSEAFMHAGECDEWLRLTIREMRKCPHGAKHYQPIVVT
jgi:hypothetical protein